MVGVREEEAEDRLRWRQVIGCRTPEGNIRKKEEKKTFLLNRDDNFFKGFLWCLIKPKA